MLTKKVKIKKLFLGHVSIRDYIVEKAIKKEQGITVGFKNLEMVITLKQLKHRFQFHQQLFCSKFSEQKYELIDFKWKPNYEKNKERN